MQLAHGGLEFLRRSRVDFQGRDPAELPPGAHRVGDLQGRPLTKQGAVRGLFPGDDALAFLHGPFRNLGQAAEVLQPPGPEGHGRKGALFRWPQDHQTSPGAADEAALQDQPAMAELLPGAGLRQLPPERLVEVGDTAIPRFLAVGRSS